MSDINWAGLVNRTNPFASFSEGLMQGAQMRQERERENLFRQKLAREERALAKAEAADTENRFEQGMLGYMARKDPRAAQAKAVEVGQYELADKFGKLDETQRKQAGERAGVLAAYVESLQTPQPGQPAPTPQTIKAQIMQDADALAELGFTREQLQAFEPTPANMARLRAEALGLKGVLEQRNAERDDRRADDAAAETKRANRERERQGNARLGIAADTNRRGWAAHNERKKAGGYGVPGGPTSGVVNPAEVEWDE